MNAQAHVLSLPGIGSEQRVPRSARSSLLGLMALLAAACTSDTHNLRDDPARAGGDSVMLDDWPEAVTLQRDTSFMYAADGDAAPLFRVRGMVPVAGGVIVANAGSHEILFVSDAGRLEWRAGRRGEGPAEFQSMGRMQTWRGDSLMTVDQSRSTVAFWTATGTHGRTQAAPPVNPAPSGDASYAWSEPRLLGVDGRGRFVFLGAERAVLEGRAGLRAVQAPVLVVDSTGTTTTLADLGGGWVYEPVSPGALPIAGYAPMSSPVMVALHPDGLVWARDDRNEIVRFDHDGQVARVYGVRRPLDEVTPALRRSYGETSSHRTWYPVSETLPYPATVPAFDRLFVGSDGSIWARRYTWGDTPEEWISFSDDVASARRLRFPRRVHVMAATADAAYGVWRDDFDVEHLVRFRLAR